MSPLRPGLRGTICAAVCAAMLVIVASPVRADPVEDDCRVERLPRAHAACLELVFDTGFLRMQESISQTMSVLQAATVAELTALGRTYESAQETWTSEVAARCGSEHEADPVAFGYCRLDALYQREDDLELSLARAANDLGAPAAFEAPIPEYVELLFPLPARLPFLGRARLPLLVPIHPH